MGAVESTWIVKVILESLLRRVIKGRFSQQHQHLEALGTTQGGVVPSLVGP